jgi:hypothetical protein
MKPSLKARRIPAYGIASALVGLGLAGSLALAGPDSKVAHITLDECLKGRPRARAMGEAQSAD